MTEAALVNKNLIGEVVARFNQGDVDLPVLPDIAMKVFNICEKDNFSLNELVKVIEADATITSKLLSISNSPRFKTVTETETLKQAINKIGVKTTRNLVFTISNRNVFKAKHPALKDLLAKLWEHSFATGIGARQVARSIRYASPDNMFTYGLLHDIGKLLFVSIFDDMLGKDEQFDEPSLLHAMDQLHADFGAALLTKWKFSDTFRTVAQCHHDLLKAPRLSRELLMVHFSNILVRDLGYSQKQGGELDLIKLESAEYLKLKKNMIVTIAEKVQSDVEDIKDIL